MLRQLDGFICYTESQRVELAGVVGSRLPLWAAFNACMSRDDCWTEIATEYELRDFIYVGRLEPRKKPHLMIQALGIALGNGAIPAKVRLVIVGGGSELPRLRDLVINLGLSERVFFAGSVTDPAALRSLYRTAIAALSPGYVGLSATQAFGFGVPMIIARQEFHSPEIEACREGENTMFFDSDSPAALGEAMTKMYQTRGAWLARRAKLAAQTGAQYSFERMTETFREAIARFAVVSQK
jgi:glycosyltransferase involved in cell wall biosynthesis